MLQRGHSYVETAGELWESKQGWLCMTHICLRLRLGA